MTTSATINTTSGMQMDNAQTLAKSMARLFLEAAMRSGANGAVCVMHGPHTAGLILS